ncbi:MAG TPA: universal stress protein [Longimicrobiales bacterium]|nr:universal stress protein [Longimicrobiales bacterium]
MYASILVPLDGSHFAEEAIPHALDLVRRSGARLHLVTVRTPTAALLAGLAGRAETDGSADPEREYLDRICEGLCDELGESVSFALLDPPVADALNDYAAAHDVDLIVMTTHGRGGLSRAWLGSVADVLVRRATMPVLLYRPGMEHGASTAFRNILVPLDGSAESETAVARALQLGALTDARYTLLYVVQMPFLMEGLSSAELLRVDADELDRRRGEAEHYLHTLAGRMQTEADVRTTTLLHERPADAILSYARDCDADVIAMATRGLGGWKRMVLGSVADKVLRGAEQPVLLYHPPDVTLAGQGEAAGELEAEAIAFRP